MAKNIKMIVYGEPGVGKSTFAAGAPRPFFITTDGNYEYLEDFCGMKPEDHQQCFSWAEMKKAFARDFTNYDTIVVDLLEDSYLWADNEFCRDNKLLHISDLGYGKGYGILGNEFFIEYQKLLALPKNIILLMHGVTEVLKDRRGVEYSKYGPSKLIRDKLITQLEGRVRFFVRAYAEATEGPDGRLLTKRYLSLAPDGHTEYGITRGLSSDAPHFIPLDWNAFMATIDQYTLQNAPRRAEPVEAYKPTVEETKLNTEEPAATEAAPKKTTRKPKEKPVKTEPDNTVDAIRAKLEAVLKKAEPIEAAGETPYGPETPEAPVVPETPIAPDPVDEPPFDMAPTPEPQVKAPIEAPVETPKVMSQAEKLAAIKAKMAALKK